MFICVIECAATSADRNLPAMDFAMEHVTNGTLGTHTRTDGRRCGWCCFFCLSSFNMLKCVNQLSHFRWYRMHDLLDIGIDIDHYITDKSDIHQFGCVRIRNRVPRSMVITFVPFLSPCIPLKRNRKW